MNVAASGAYRTEEEWWLALLAAVISSAVAGAAAARAYVERTLGLPPGSTSMPPVVDAAIGLVIEGTATATTAARAVQRAMRPISGLMLRPPLVPERMQPQAWLETLARHGRTVRIQSQPLLDGIVPAVVAAALDRIDLTGLVSERVEVNRIAERLDVNRVVERVELNAIVDRVPIDRVLDRVDIDQIAAKLDVDAIISRVDIDQIAARLDLDAIIDRLDLATIANQVIDEIDLPDIIRESSGAMTSEAMIGLRMQGIEADERVSRIVDRILLRRNARKTQAQRRSGGGDETAE